MERIRQPEVLTGFLAIVWGLVILSPIDTFTHFPIVYAPMRHIAPEPLWGLFVIILGLISLTLSLQTLLARAAMLNAIVFTFLSMLHLLGDKKSVGGFIYAAVSVFNIVCWRSRRWPKK